MIKSLFE
jgi:predicted HTH transcriptional regulator